MMEKEEEKNWGCNPESQEQKKKEEKHESHESYFFFFFDEGWKKEIICINHWINLKKKILQISDPGQGEGYKSRN